MTKTIEDFYQKYGVQNVELLNARGGDILEEADVDDDTCGRYNEVLSDIQEILTGMYQSGIRSPVDMEEHLTNHPRW